jgi:hypothetical protein
VREIFIAAEGALARGERRFAGIVAALFELADEPAELIGPLQFVSLAHGAAPHSSIRKHG